MKVTTTTNDIRLTFYYKPRITTKAYYKANHNLEFSIHRRKHLFKATHNFIHSQEWKLPQVKQF